MPCLRQSLPHVAPASCSARMPTICSAENLDRFIICPFGRTDPSSKRRNNPLAGQSILSRCLTRFAAEACNFGAKPTPFREGRVGSAFLRAPRYSSTSFPAAAHRRGRACVSRCQRASCGGAQENSPRTLVAIFLSPPVVAAWALLPVAPLYRPSGLASERSQLRADSVEACRPRARRHARAVRQHALRCPSSPRR